MFGKRFVGTYFILALFTLIVFCEFATCETPYNMDNFNPLIDESGNTFEKCAASSFSPDGQKIIFLASQPGKNSISEFPAIWMADVDGTNRTLIYANDSIENPYLFSKGPQFSPDGKMIVFVEMYMITPGKKGELSIRTVSRNESGWDNTSKAIYSVVNKGLDNSIFTPDGKNIVYFSNEGEEMTSGDIWIMDSDGTNRTQVTNAKERPYKMSVSADGDKIVYLRCGENGNHEMWMVNIDGTNNHLIIPESEGSDDPVFMPDGKIMYRSYNMSPHSEKRSSGNIWMMDQDGSNQTLLIPRDGFNDYPAISPDGTMIIYEHGLYLYFVEDPDGDGIWEDSDNDGVADICDGYPYDPGRGYLTDDEDVNGDDDHDDGISINIAFCAIAILIIGGMITIAILVERDVRKKDLYRDMHQYPPMQYRMPRQYDPVQNPWPQDPRLQEPPPGHPPAQYETVEPQVFPGQEREGEKDQAPGNEQEKN